MIQNRLPGLRTLTVRVLLLVLFQFITGSNIANSDIAETMGISGDVPPQVMQNIYEQVKTPYKYGIVIKHPEGHSVDCPSVLP